MSKAGIYNIEIEQGATYSSTVQYTDDSGVPIDLTSCEIRLGIKDQITDTTFLKFLDNGVNGGITVTNALQGTFRIYISPIETAAFTFNRAVYDLEVQFPNGDIERLIKGRVLVSREVTDGA